ncbi:PLP-dependent aminotransferase family protein [Streptomyces chryseus]|uniref:2-aminoadipate aminotransferase n=1 Tax=Streptomyces chryseus TaxID=68186 RepID=A0ABQ3DJA6_9ACTN|nr:PLP-dependent aminotransferase family protein [Streptomyces chryseus]GGX13816.1 2-aminoadipate aminotransferase [Streptomyces chryseus]GHA97641.1 2-aminoadipate aminotransferase [Streptomyces chryseus]
MTVQTVHFSRGIPPLDAIPSAAIAEHTSAVLAAEPDRVFQYAPIGRHTGDQELREQLGKFHSVDPDRVFVTNGSLQALDLLAAHELRDTVAPEVLVEAPTYDRAVQIFERHGAQVSGVPLRHDGLDLDVLRERLRTKVPAFVYVIPDFQNPSGVTTSEDKRRELVRLSAEYGFTILEDIPYRELRFSGTAPTPLGELAESTDGARVLTIGSLSKVLSPGLRVGYVIGPPGAPQALAALAESIYLSPAPLLQAVAARALANGLVQENLEHVRQLLRPRHDAAVEAVRQTLGEVHLCVPEGGYYISVHLPIRTDEESFLTSARNDGLALTRGSAFYPADSAPPSGTAFLRLPFQALDPEEFAEGVRRLAAAARRAA